MKKLMKKIIKRKALLNIVNKGQSWGNLTAEVLISLYQILCYSILRRAFLIVQRPPSSTLLHEEKIFIRVVFVHRSVKQPSTQQNKVQVLMTLKRKN